MSTIPTSASDLALVIDLPVEQLLPRLRRLLHRDWDTRDGTAARRILWSLYNQQSPPVQLWSELGELEPGQLAELCKLLQCSPDIRAARLSALFTLTGELERIDRYPLYPEPFRPICFADGRPALVVVPENPSPAWHRQFEEFKRENPGTWAEKIRLEEPA